MKKTYQTPVITVIEIAVESQILAASTLHIRNDDEYIEYPEMIVKFFDHFLALNSHMN